MGNIPAKLDDETLRTRAYLDLSVEEHHGNLEKRGCSCALSHHPADRALAIRLNNALANPGRRVIARWDEEEPDLTPELLDEAHRAIEEHDCFVAIISRASLASELCRFELEHAVRCGKRILPVEAEQMDEVAQAGGVPPAIASRKAVFLTPQSDFGAGVRLLGKLMDVERQHVRTHTLLLTRAVAWEAFHARNRRMLLRGDDKRRALAFLDRAASGTGPFPCSLVLDFLFCTFQRAQRAIRSRPPPADALQLACSSYTKAALRPPAGTSSVFVSFAAEDADFARELVAALRERQPERRVLAHFGPREQTKEQRDAINANIQEAEVFVYVISPDSLASEASGWDMDHCSKCSKRLVPVVARQVDLRTIPVELADVPWVFFDGGLGSFDYCVGAIAERSDRDLPHVQYHSRLLAYAVTWLQGGRAAKALLRGSDVQSAVEWAVAAALGKGPFPTRLHLEYLAACVGKQSVWLAAQVPEVAETASLPPDPQLPAFCRKEWIPEVVANEDIIRESGSAAMPEVAAAAASAAAADEAEVSVFDPSSSADSLPGAEDGQEAAAEAELSWAPVNTVKPLFDASGADRYSADPENEEAFLDSLLEEDLRAGEEEEEDDEKER